MMENDIAKACNQVPPAMPKSRLVSIVGILEAVSAISEGEITIPELADAIRKHVYDADEMMIYRGGGYGLAEPITGNPLEEHDGYNTRAEIVFELFNCRFWNDPNASMFGGGSETLVRNFCVLKEDGVEIAKRLWKFFYPNRELEIDESTLDDCLSSAGMARSEVAAQSEERPVYSTPHLAIMQAAIAHFFEPRRERDAKKEEVVEWIKTQMTAAGMADSDNIAQAVFTIIKPSDHDPRKRRG